ncbi:MAG: glycosyltransferase family 4 protein [Candidatus Peribacteraceae bacterium]|jgi:glycosyltransferase involved in cell wall biosynthesis
MLKSSIVILSAFVTPFRSGAEACVEEVSSRLKDRFDITIVTARLRRDLPGRDVLNGVNVVRVGIGSSADKWFFPVLAPFAAKKLRPQIVHAVLESYAGAAMMFCGCIVPGAKRILTCQSTNTSFLVSAMHKLADRVTVISSVLVERAKKFGRSDVTLIPNGIPYGAIREECSKTPKVTGRILFVGRLEQMKGVDTLLAALRLLKEKTGQIPDLHVIGDGSLRGVLEAQSRSFLSEGSFYGYLPPAEVQREMAEAEIFVGLSRSEALGNVFLEAQAAGCAVVGTNVGGIPDIVKNGANGLLVPADDPAKASVAIEKLLKDSPERLRLSEAGIAFAKQYDWQGIAEKYASVYEASLR